MKSALILLALSSIILCARAITSVLVNLHSLNAGVQGLSDISFSSTIDVPIGGTIEIAFPIGFQTSSQALTLATGLDAGCVVSSNILTRTVSMTIVNSIMVSGGISFTIDKITNPGALFIFIKFVD